MIIFLFEPKMMYLDGDIKLENLEGIAVSKIYENSLFNFKSSFLKSSCKKYFLVCFLLVLFESLLNVYENVLWIYSFIPNITDY